ncbi:hypothetical protein F9278_20440 [Streptomyces phaeolivaceus]|uniref:Uncharacterized protein n=1 Tax=Streptomyces phaeolivaceus TaxID=2653200 RepID=A0A5P8KIQ9_9ACTN|nr:hypothetical protein F9278_20440 [Streptomyces phaeolivaceus]
MATLATGLAALALSAGLLTGREFGDSLDCVPNADTIAESLRDIHRTGESTDITDTIEKNLDEIGDEAADERGDVDKAVDDLAEAVKDYDRSILNGDTDPDTSRIDAAADEPTDVCTS